MKRWRISRRRLAGGAAALLAAIVVGVVLVPELRGDAPGASPAALNRIRHKNERAAIEAAATMRSQSRVQAEAADSLRAAEERGRARAEAVLARFDNSEAGRTDREPTAKVAQ